jgi:photosystem II stability/assembly factor-like uncharacterized protein
MLAPPQAAAAANPIAPWTKLAGIPGGSLGRLAVDPNNPAIVFAGAGGGGLIFRSADGGATYAPIAVGGAQEAFRAITVDPQNSSIVFAFSTDDYYTGQHGAIYKSLDGGLTWAKLAAQPVGTTAAPYANVGNGRGLFIDKTGKYLVAVDKRQGAYYSANLGASWTNPLPHASARLYALAADPNHSTTLWAGGYDPTNNFTGALWTTTSLGKTWTKVSIPVLSDYTQPLPYALAILPKSGKIVVGWSGLDANGNAVGGVVTSVDGGVTWVNSSTGLPYAFNPGNALVVDPQTPTTLYLTDNGGAYPASLYKSTDSGATWTAITVGGADGLFTAVARPAKGAMPAAILAGGDLFSSTDHGVTWVRSDAGVAIGDIQQIRDDAITSGGLYASTADGLFHSTNSGQSWTKISTWAGASVPRAIAVDPVSSTHDLYVSTQTGLWHSVNAGASWTALSVPASVVGDIAFLLPDPTLKGRLTATDTANNIFHSANYGQTWTPSVVGVDNDVFTGSPAPIVFDAGKASTIYAAVTSEMWKSTNSGANWLEATTLPVDAGGLLSIAALAGKPNALFAAVGHTDPATGNFTYALQKSVNAAASWTALGSPFASLDPNAPYDPFYVMAPAAGGYLYSYGYQGDVVRSPNGAVGSWTLIDGPIDAAFTGNAAVFADSKNLYVWDSYLSGNAFVAPLSSLTTTPSGDRTGIAPIDRDGALTARETRIVR